jgi:hypothetical protein
MGPNKMPSVDSATHLGIIRTTSLIGNMTANVEENITKRKEKHRWLTWGRISWP